MLPKLEEALNLKKVGDAVSVDVEPADAFGDYDPELVKLEPADRLPPDVEVGMQFEAYTSADDEHGSGIGVHRHRHRRRQGRCSTAITRGPASGCASTARSSTCAPATAEEVEHGHVHGAGGHHH